MGKINVAKRKYIFLSVLLIYAGNIVAVALQSVFHNANIRIGVAVICVVFAVIMGQKYMYHISEDTVRLPYSPKKQLIMWALIQSNLYLSMIFAWFQAPSGIVYMGNIHMIFSLEIVFIYISMVGIWKSFDNPSKNRMYLRGSLVCWLVWYVYIFIKAFWGTGFGFWQFGQEVEKVCVGFFLCIIAIIMCFHVEKRWIDKSNR